MRFMTPFDVRSPKLPVSCFVGSFSVPGRSHATGWPGHGLAGEPTGGGGCWKAPPPSWSNPPPRRYAVPPHSFLPSLRTDGRRYSPPSLLLRPPTEQLLSLPWALQWSCALGSGSGLGGGGGGGGAVNGAVGGDLLLRGPRHVPSSLKVTIDVRREDRLVHALLLPGPLGSSPCS